MCIMYGLSPPCSNGKLSPVTIIKTSLRRIFTSTKLLTLESFRLGIINPWKTTFFKGWWYYLYCSITGILSSSSSSSITIIIVIIFSLSIIENHHQQSIDRSIHPFTSRSVPSLTSHKEKQRKELNLNPAPFAIPIYGPRHRSRRLRLEGTRLL